MNVNAKPLSELSRLIKCLEVAGTPFKTEPQQFITTGNNDDEPLTFVIQSGLTVVHRKSDELLVGIARAPYIHGLSAWINDSYLEYSLMAQTPCSGFCCQPLLHAKLFKKHNFGKKHSAGFHG